MKTQYQKLGLVNSIHTVNPPMMQPNLVYHAAPGTARLTHRQPALYPARQRHVADVILGHGQSSQDDVRVHQAQHLWPQQYRAQHTLLGG